MSWVADNSKLSMARGGVRDIIVIHRLEYPFPICYLCRAIWGACFAVGDVRQLLDVSVFMASMANLLFIVAALPLNTAVDIHIDERLQEKSYLAAAVLRFGRGRAFLWATTEMAVALALVALVSVWLDRWLLTGIAVVIIMLQLLYNVEPARLKRRGFAGPVAFCIAAVILPCVLSYGAVRAEVDTSVWSIFVGFGVLAVGRMTWWSVPDLSADAATGMRTPTVRYGVTHALALSCLIMLAGLLLIGWGLWRCYGLAWVVPGVAAHGIFLGAALALLRRTSNEALPSSTRMRRETMSLVMIGEVVFVIIPLVAG